VCRIEELSTYNRFSISFNQTNSTRVERFTNIRVKPIDQATHSANALISRAGNEANVLAGNFDIIFKENMNRNTAANLLSHFTIILP